jgi:hypothetical protein
MEFLEGNDNLILAYYAMFLIRKQLKVRTHGLNCGHDVLGRWCR